MNTLVTLQCRQHTAMSSARPERLNQVLGMSRFCLKVIANQSHVPATAHKPPPLFPREHSLCELNNMQCCIQNAQKEEEGNATVAPNVNLLVALTLHAGFMLKKQHHTVTNIFHSEVLVRK